MLLGILVLNLRRFAENQASDRGGKIDPNKKNNILK